MFSIRRNMKKKTQRDKIRSHMARGWKLTRAGAFELYATLNLPAVIEVLRGEGMKIDMKKVKNPRTGTTYAVYQRRKA
jgi:hypothetical protein